MSEVFRPSREEGVARYCAGCGHYGLCSEEVSYYSLGESVPRLWIPRAWSILAASVGCSICEGMLMCERCSFISRENPFEYAEKHRVSINENGVTFRLIVEPVQPSYAPDVAPITPMQEEPPVKDDIDTPEPEVSKAREQAREIGGAFALAGELALVNEAGETMLDFTRELTKDVPLMPLVLDHPDGREVVKIGTAILLQTMAFHTNLVPQPKFVRRAARRQITASGLFLMKDRMRAVSKYLQKIAGIGEKLSPDEFEQLGDGADHLEQLAGQREKAAAER